MPRKCKFLSAFNSSTSSRWVQFRANTVDGGSTIGWVTPNYFLATAASTEKAYLDEPAFMQTYPAAGFGLFASQRFVFYIDSGTAMTQDIERTIFEWYNSAGTLAGDVRIIEKSGDGLTYLRVYDKDGNKIGSDVAVSVDADVTLFLRQQDETGGGGNAIIAFRVGISGTVYSDATLAYDTALGFRGAGFGNGFKVGVVDTNGSALKIRIKEIACYEEEASFLPEGNVYTAGPPASDGATDWTPLGGGGNFQEVDEFPAAAPDDATSYNTGAVGGGDDTYGHSATQSSGTGERVSAMMVMGRWTRVAGTSNDTVSLLIDTPDDAIWASAGVWQINPATGGWMWYTDGVGEGVCVTDQPTSTDQWSDAAFNGAKVGFRNVPLGTALLRCTSMLWFYDTLKFKEVAAHSLAIVADEVKSVAASTKGDTYMDSVATTTNYGTSTIMIVNFTDGGKNPDTIDRLIIWYDVTGISPPGGQELNEAKWYGWVSSIVGTPTQFTIQRVTRAFVEEQVTWAVYSTGNSWTVPGGDYSTPSTTPSPPTTALQHWGTDVADLFADAQASRSDEMEFGIRFTNEVTGGTRKAQFNTRNHGSAAMRPILVITWKDIVVGGRRRYGAII